MKPGKPISSAIKIKAKKVKDYIQVIQNAEDLFELYNANIQLEKLKGALLKKRGSNQADVLILAEIDLASKLQDICKRLV